MHPKTIDPCPIIESIVEIRYSSTLPGDAVFGFLYALLGLKDDFPKVEAQPILQIPELIRNQDDNLRYQAHYILSQGDSLQLKIGPKAIVFGCVNTYVGWDRYSAFIKKYLAKLNGTPLIDVVERIGLRYINLFKYEILDKIKMDISLSEEKISEGTMTLRLERKHGSMLEVFQIANNVGVQTAAYAGSGSTIDIDCIQPIMEKFDSSGDKLFKVIEQLHAQEKDSFYSVLRPEFVATLNPKY